MTTLELIKRLVYALDARIESHGESSAEEQSTVAEARAFLEGAVELDCGPSWVMDGNLVDCVDELRDEQHSEQLEDAGLSGPVISTIIVRPTNTASSTSLRASCGY